MQTVALLISVAFGFETTRGFLLQKDDPEIMVHHKEPGNGYKKGSPLYKGDGKSTASSDLDLTCNDPAPPAEGGCTPPVSTTMKCVINLAIQYFLLYSALACARSLRGKRMKPVSCFKIAVQLEDGWGKHRKGLLWF
jgi:hypothetical protein